MTTRIVAFLFALLSVQPTFADQSEALALKHVTVIDGTGAPAQPGMTVLITSGHIAELGKCGSVSIPAGARVVDAAGKFLIPGLWDMHVHWYDEASLPVFLANGDLLTANLGSTYPVGYPVPPEDSANAIGTSGSVSEFNANGSYKQTLTDSAFLADPATAADAASDGAVSGVQASLAADSRQVAPVMHYAPGENSN